MPGRAGEVEGRRRRVESAVFYCTAALCVAVALSPDNSEPWREGVFICLVGSLTALRVVGGLFGVGGAPPSPYLMVAPAAIVAFSLIQATWGNGWGALTHAGGDSGSGISADPFGTVQFAIRLAALTMLGGLLLRYTTSHRRLRVLTHCVLFACVANALFGLVQHLSTPETPGASLLPYVGAGGSFGLMGNRNHFAYMMEMGLGLLAGLVIVPAVSGNRLPAYLAGVVLLCVALVMCNSRGGVFSLLGQALFAAIFFTKVRRRRHRHHSDQVRAPGATWSLRGRVLAHAVRVGLALLFFVAVSAGVVLVGGERLGVRLDELNEEVAAEAQDAPPPTRRLEIWEGTWQLFKTAPAVGVGFGAYWVGISKTYTSAGEVVPYQAHNDYLEVLASGGVVGAALFVWLFAVVLRRAWSRLSSPDPFLRGAGFGALVGLTGVAIHSAVEFGLHDLSNAVVFVALLVIASAEMTARVRAPQAAPVTPAGQVPRRLSVVKPARSHTV